MTSGQLWALLALIATVVVSATLAGFVFFLKWSARDASERTEEKEAMSEDSNQDPSGTKL